MSGIRALVVDYGGVLTVPIRTAFDAWLAAEQVSPEEFVALLIEWRDTPDNPMHRLETGAITDDEFSAELTARLRRGRRRRDAAGRPGRADVPRPRAGPRRAGHAERGPLGRPAHRPALQQLGLRR